MGFINITNEKQIYDVIYSYWSSTVSKTQLEICNGFAVCRQKKKMRGPGAARGTMRVCITDSESPLREKKYKEIRKTVSA